MATPPQFPACHALMSAALVLVTCPPRVSGEVTLIGDPISLAIAGTFWIEAEYGAEADQYLVLRVDVTDASGWQLKWRRVDADTGDLIGAEAYMSNDLSSVAALIGSAAYNPRSGEWLVAYQAGINGGQDDVLGQRIGSDGDKAGSHIPLVVKPGYQNQADIAFSPADARYLVVWNEKIGTDRQVLSRLFDESGTIVGPETQLSEVDNRSKYGPRVAYSPLLNEFMVIWLDYRHWPGSGQDNDYGDIYGQRVNAATGVKIGANIPVYVPQGTPYVPNGQDTPGGIACSTRDGHFAIGVTKLTAPLGWTTLGLVVDSHGTLVGNVFNLSHPEFGAQATPAFNTTDDTFLVTSEGPQSNIVGRRVSTSGVPLGPTESVFSVPGGVRDNVLAVRPGDGRFLQVCASDSGVWTGRLFITGEDMTAPAPVSDFVVEVGFKENTLIWRNPGDSDFTATLVLFRVDACPQGVDDPLASRLTDKTDSPGSTERFVHSDLDDTSAYFYAAYAHDGTPNYAAAATGYGRPLAPGDFDGDHDVDQDDFGALQRCLGGSGFLPEPGCEKADLDGDLDVDQQDVVLFQSCLGGASRVPEC